MPLGRRVSEERLGRQDRLASQAQQGQQAVQARLGHRGDLVLPGRRAIKVQRALEEHKEPRACKVLAD